MQMKKTRKYPFNMHLHHRRLSEILILVTRWRCDTAVSTQRRRTGVFRYSRTMFNRQREPKSSHREYKTHFSYILFMHRHTANMLTGIHAMYMITYREMSKYTHLLTSALSAAWEPQPIVFFGTLMGSWGQRAIIVTVTEYGPGDGMVLSQRWSIGRVGSVI